MKETSSLHDVFLESGRMLQDHKLVKDEYIPELRPELICREAGFARNSVCVTDT